MDAIIRGMQHVWPTGVNFAYVAPTQKQAKLVAWPYLKEFAAADAMRYLCMGYREFVPEPQKSRESTFRPLHEMSYREYIRASGYGTRFAPDDEGDEVRAASDWRRRAREERI